nr:Cas9 [uncultured organism]
MTHNAYTLGLDIGTNSIGWCILGDQRIQDIGVRIFSDGRDPKSKMSLAVDRRAARAMRRRRDRYVRRRMKLLNLLVEYGLLPLDKQERKALQVENPYQIRALALDEALPAFQIGRALFHLNQRRGFKSNRKTDKGDPESGKISSAVVKLDTLMREAGSRTFGEFLWKRLQAGLPVRIRMRDGEGPEKKDGSRSDGYAFYPDRASLEAEFEAIWTAQAAHHTEIMTAARKAHLFDVIFYQRPLKQPDVGLCAFLGGETGERRLAKSDPLFQKRRLLEELNALTIERGPGMTPERLTPDQRDRLLMLLRGKKSVSFSSMRKTLKLGDAVFNKERAGRDKLLGDEVFAELSNKTRFGPAWGEVPIDDQRRIVARLRDEQDGAKLVDWLMTECSLGEGRARAVAGARLPEHFGRTGETATRAIIRELSTHTISGKVCVYSEAVANAPELKHHSDFRTGEIMDTLPYYGEVLDRHIMPGTGDPGDPIEVRIGKLTNPTVHIGLNQLRRLINQILKVHGHPKQVIVEIARDLKSSEDQKKDIQRRQKQDQQEAERRGRALLELGQPNTGANRALLKLWEELNPGNPLDRRCIYTGQMISPRMLFSGAVDVDHILPWSRTLDDSSANKLVCMSDANRQKRNQTPFEAWGGTADWDGILARASALPASKAMRFNPDAMNRFDNEGGFLARHLVDTQYLSRLAKTYLEAIAPDRVYVSTGHLTAMLRRHWGLNSLLPDHNFSKTVHEKNRLDHRHHAIDAAVVGVLTLGLIQRVSKAAGQRELAGVQDVVDSIAPPWESFRDDLGRVLAGLIVSHRPDHGTIGGARSKAFDQTAGRLHNDTAYGLTGETDTRANGLVVHRVSLAALKPSHLEPEGARIRDEEIRLALRKHTQGLDGKAFTDAVLDFARKDPKFKGMRAVRVIEPLAVIPIKNGDGQAYKGYKGDANYRYDVWERPDGSWAADVISMFDAHSGDYESPIKRAYPTARKVLRLHQNDMVRFDDEKAGDGIARVVKFGQSGSIYLALHNESGALKARDSLPQEDDPFKYLTASASRLKNAKARQVYIDEIGRIRDPGPRTRP